MRRLALILVFFLAPFAVAQEATIPKYDNPFVNDFADVLSPEAEAEIKDTLTALRDDKDVEMSVLTIRSRDEYGLHASLESFARDVFNNWGIGDASRNDGILLLLARDDRQARIELGSGYGREMDRVAETILDETILPNFADGDFVAGLTEGSREITARIGRGQPKSGKDAGSSDNWIIALIGGVMALFIGRAVYTNRKSRRCPACQSNDIDKTPDPENRRSRKCNNCGHVYLAPAFMGDSGTHGGGGGFGGGSSSGGGASGNF